MGLAIFLWTPLQPTIKTKEGAEPMRINKDLVPIIRKEDMDSLAATFLQTYCPEALRQPMPLPVEDIAELQMGLDIDYVNITDDCRTLGMMIFSGGVTEIYCFSHLAMSQS